MRKFYLFCSALVIVVAFSAASIMANPAIMKKHAGKKKDGKSVNCGYCHTAANGAKIEKKKGQNLKALEKHPTCVGAGCHN
ncbi:MAG: hypothetical protein JXA07_08590 [Spirochaetes bacterium]|nr:hypothetical protein [Spirochaetota bacterium]